jgi:opacity protein-like surface antigen
MKKVLLLVLGLLLLSSSSFASLPAPSLTGASGLTRIPDATVIPFKNWNLASDYGMQNTGANNSQQPTFNYKANLGAFHNFELGLVGGLDQAAKELRDGVYVNLKYSPTLGDGSDPLLLAIGVENLASKTQTGVYMVATKPFIQGPKLSFGFLADFPGNKFRPLGMAGLDVPIGTMSILTDLFAGENLFQLNGGVRYRIIPTFAFDGRAINIFGDQQNQNAITPAKDPRQFLFGFSWLNPF